MSPIKLSSLYGLEAVNLSSSDFQHLERVHVKFLRQVLGKKAFSVVDHDAKQWKSFDAVAIRKKANMHTIKSIVTCKRVLWFQKQVRKELSIYGRSRYYSSRKNS